MARSRLIKPALAKNEVLAELGPEAQLLFALLPCFADREGRLEDRPLRIKAEIFPYAGTQGYYEVDCDALLESLATCPEKFITRYEINGKRFIQITNFALHQSPHHKETASTIQAQSLLESTKDQPRAKHDNPGSEAPNKDKNKDKEEEEVTSDKHKLVELPADFDKELRAAVTDWLAYKTERNEAYKPTGHKQFITRVGNLARERGSPHVVEKLKRAMASGWKGWDFQNGDKNGKPRKDTGTPSPTARRGSLSV